MTVDGFASVVLVGIAVLTALYLFVALLDPERF
ncbi:potassium-transporting ATPase subunit F [Rhodococcus sp. G-MC3]|nr:potassium-transporting ATPase subunit F [Rhodococcus sp. G-MC3]MDJ0394215.1 potassium-transporting ATPase subunit F [Rhodococcus sp. G-MC3]